MIYVFLAEGFEELEAMAPIDILRRGNAEVKTVSVTDDKTVTGSHGIPVICDITAKEITTDNLQGVILPGGMPGTLNLEKSDAVQELLDYCSSNNLLIAAICAAPSVLGHKELLKGKKATCFKGFEKDLIGAFVSDEKVVEDQNIITSCGAGAAYDFGFRILSFLEKNNEKAEEISASMRYSG
ncbi:MAG: DJ-1/PfpI family protein [Clostridia bacterium]|nr:DJ-1/PfpI family protein [Clostridia bacterium]